MLEFLLYLSALRSHPTFYRYGVVSFETRIRQGSLCRYAPIKGVIYDSTGQVIAYYLQILNRTTSIFEVLFADGYCRSIEVRDNCRQGNDWVTHVLPREKKACQDLKPYMLTDSEQNYSFLSEGN